MSMSTASKWLVEDENFDPDTLKMPENPKHRRMIDTIAVVARHYVSTGTTVYCDMNWYPPDGGHAMAPDIMTLQAGVLDAKANSYRQHKSEMPFPGVVVEVPSASDSFDGLRAKSARYSGLGVDVYVVSIDSLLEVALRLAPGSSDFVPWTGKPISPLGGLSIDVLDGEPVVRAPDGRIITPESDVFGMVIAAEQRAAEAQAVAAEAQAGAAQAEARAAEFEAKLLSLGVDPNVV